MRVVKAAAVQLSPVLYSRDGTVDKVVRTIHTLGQQEVQFASSPRRWCRTIRGVVGYKPTPGRWPNDGAVLLETTSRASDGRARPTVRSRTCWEDR